MIRLTFSDLPRLVDVQEEACVSLYLGAGRNGLFSGPTLQTYRHALRRAETALGSRTGKDVRDRVLDSLRVFSSLQAAAPRAKGLAVFSSPTLCGWFPFSENVGTHFVVAESFHIKPLLPFLDESQRWWLLDLRADHARLHECVRGQGEEVGRCLVGLDRLRARHRDRPTGEEGGVPNAATRLLTWARARFPLGPVPLLVRCPVDAARALRPLARLSSLPTPFFYDPTAVLHDDVLITGLWERVRPALEARRMRLFERLRAEATQGRATTDPRALLERLRSRTVREIVLRQDAHLPGLIDWKKGRIDLGTADARGERFGDCVLDDLAERALRSRCKVVVATRDDLPPGADLVAL